MSRKYIALLGAAALFIAGVVVFRYTPAGASALWNMSNGGTFLLPLVSVAALIDSINPCAFSILLLTIAFLVSIGRTRTSILKIGGSYVFGIFAAYILIGLGILQALHLFNTPHFMAKLGAVLMAVFGIINLIHEFFPSFPIKFRIPQAAHASMAGLMEKASLPTAFALGGLVGLCEFPCTGGPYLMILGLLHDQGSYLSGVGYLLLYNLIFVLPLFIMLFLASNNALLEKVKAWKKSETKHMKLWTGVAMVLLGLLIFFV